MTAPTHLFKCPGPVSQAFFDSVAEIAFIRGPVGSGKTATLINKILTLAMMQRPSPLDNTRYTRWIAVRDTYRQLQNTTIPSYKDWTVKKGLAPKSFTGGRGGVPGLHHIKGALADGTKMDCEVHFIAIEDKAVEDAMRGLEFTGLWPNETDLCAEEIITWAVTRYGRYPGKQHGGPSWAGILGDYNAPDDDNYMYVFAEESRPENMAFFVQPGGLEPGAENLQNLPGGRDYYQRQIEALKNKPWMVDRMVHNRYARSREGKPIYTQYDDKVHMSPVPLKAIENVDLVIGLDAGRTPAALIKQQAPGGQVRVLREFMMEGAAGPRFGKELGRLLARDFPGIPAYGVADPAAVNATENSDDPWIDQVAQAADIRVEPAMTNNPRTRIDASQTLFEERIDAITPRVIIDPSCVVYRKACNSKYHYRKIQGSARREGTDQFTEEPVKNHPWSDLCDAGGYADMEIIGERGLHGVRSPAGRSSQPHGLRSVESESYDPFSV